MPTDDSLEYKGDPNVERLAKQDSREQYDDVKTVVKLQSILIVLLS